MKRIGKNLVKARHQLLIFSLSLKTLSSVHKTILLSLWTAHEQILRTFKVCVYELCKNKKSMTNTLNNSNDFLDSIKKSVLFNTFFAWSEINFSIMYQTIQFWLIINIESFNPLLFYSWTKILIFWWFSRKKSDYIDIIKWHFFMSFKFQSLTFSIENASVKTFKT